MGLVCPAQAMQAGQLWLRNSWWLSECWDYQMHALFWVCASGWCTVTEVKQLAASALQPPVPAQIAYI
jgi:hypothetical protein